MTRVLSWSTLTWSKAPSSATEHRYIRRPLCRSRENRLRCYRSPRTLRIACSSTWDGPSTGASGRPVVIGLNQYSHDAGCCVVDATTGEILMALAKERISRVKHDGGAVGEVVQTCCEALDISMDDIKLVVTNNHHFRVLPFEKRLTEFGLPMGVYDSNEYGSQWNLLPGVRKVELSHHLAHAWSVSPFCPKERRSSAVVVVMDGMGEAIREMQNGARHYPEEYFSDLDMVPTEYSFPDMADRPWDGYREAETVYMLDADGRVDKGIWKRWTRENSPPELFNHGFQDMESCGAVYSRVASNIFGHWNHCGKVMGLAPWASKWNAENSTGKPLMQGPLIDGSLDIDWATLAGGRVARPWHDEENKSDFAALAWSVQANLETVVLDFLSDLRRSTNATTLCFCGGVALNSTLNGRIARESGFDEILFTPFPGDEGIAVGCAMFGYQLLNGSVPDPSPLTPYLGRSYDDMDVEDALEEFSDWVVFEETEDSVDAAASLLLDHGVIGWYQGRSEVGPRALGNRSILADPRNADTRDFINSKVKRREEFRPLAPAIPEEEVSNFFVVDDSEQNVSPFMSITAQVREDKMDLIPATTHVDGSARLQTVTANDNPRFYRLINVFGERSGVPVLLNTSFNVAGEPIVETPRDALVSFLSSSLPCIVFEQGVVRRRSFPEGKALLESDVRAACPLLRIEETASADRSFQRILAYDGDRMVDLKNADVRRLLEIVEKMGSNEVATVRDVIQAYAEELLTRTAAVEDEAIRHVKYLHDALLVAVTPP